MILFVKKKIVFDKLKFKIFNFSSSETDNAHSTIGDFSSNYDTGYINRKLMLIFLLLEHHHWN